MTETDQALAGLRAKYGARWEIWHVPHSVQRGGTWCANPWAKKDDRRHVLHAGTPEHLAEYIADAEAEADR